MELEEIKQELKTIYDGFVEDFSEYKSKYLKQFEPELQDFYDSKDYPDNIEMRFQAVVERFSPDEIVVSIKFLIGDFNLWFGCQHCYPYGKTVDYDTALFLHDRLGAIGILNQPEPVKVDSMVYRLFPDLRRKKHIEEILREE